MAMPMTTVLGGKALDAIGKAGDRPSLLSNIYDRKRQREMDDLERRKIEAEARYKDRLAAKEAEAAQEALRMDSMRQQMPQVDPNGTDGEIVDQWKKQAMYWNNLGYPEEGKKVMAETKNLIASSSGNTDTLEEDKLRSGTNKNQAMANKATEEANWIRDQKGVTAQTPRAPDLMALQKWVDEQPGKEGTGLFGFFQDPEFDIDMLYAEARAIQDQIRPQRNISIVEAATIWKQQKAHMKEMEARQQAIGGVPQGSPQAPSGAPNVPNGLPPGWSAVD
jgi:hypothetical protein